MAEVARTRQIPPGRLRSATGGRGNRRDWRLWAAAAAAAVIIAVGAGVAGFSISNQRVDSARSQAAAAQARQEQISTIMSAPDARLKIVTMQASGSQVTLVISDRLNEGVAVLSHMPALHPDQAYQLWVIHGSTPVPAGVLCGRTMNGTEVFTDVAGAGGVRHQPRTCRRRVQPADTTRGVIPDLTPRGTDVAGAPQGTGHFRIRPATSEAPACGEHESASVHGHARTAVPVKRT